LIIEDAEDRYRGDAAELLRSPETRCILVQGEMRSSSGAAERLAGLFSRHAGQPPTTLTRTLEARILEWSIKRKPRDGSTHGNTRKLATQVGVGHTMVARVWRKHGLRPHRLEVYLASNDPDFETKAADIIGLYPNPPQHVTVFCVDEKTAIQALDRKDPVLLLSPGRAERHGFEYNRHAALSLFAAFNSRQTREVLKVR
jgi:hypothetical protein